MIDRFLAEHTYSNETKDKYRRVLLELINVDNLDQLSAVDLLDFVKRPNWGSSARYVALAGAKAFLKWRYGASHPALTARLQRRKPKRQRRLSPEQALRLLASFDKSTPKGSRDLAIASLALDTGLRVSELCRIKLVDTNLQERSLQVVVKGGEWGMAVFSQQTATNLSAWLGNRDELARADVENLFVSVGGTKRGYALTRSGLQRAMKIWGEELGFKLSPHDLRRTFAVLSTMNGAPSRVVQVAGRWSDINMVEYYTRDLEQQAISPYLPVSNLLG